MDVAAAIREPAPALRLPHRAAELRRTVLQRRDLGGLHVQYHAGSTATRRVQSAIAIEVVVEAPAYATPQGDLAQRLGFDQPPAIRGVVDGPPYGSSQQPVDLEGRLGAGMFEPVRHHGMRRHE